MAAALYVHELRYLYNPLLGVFLLYIYTFTTEQNSPQFMHLGVQLTKLKHWFGADLTQKLLPYVLLANIQYIPRNMHTVFALLCFVVVIHWLIFPYPSGLLHWHCGNLSIAPVPAKQPWWIWINTLCQFIMNDCITTTKQSTTKPCAYFLGYTVSVNKCCQWAAMTHVAPSRQNV